MPKRGNIFQLPLLLLLTALSSHAIAEEEQRWYDVEVLLFVQKSQDYRDSELWPIDYTLPDLENARELLPPPEQAKAGTTAAVAAMPTPFRLLADDELRLSADAERIERAPDIELLLHLGWRQPGLPEDQAIAVRIDDGMLQDTTGAEETAATTAQSESAISATAMVQNAPRLEGTLRLILSRYLHIETDLLYREPLDEEAGVVAGGNSDDGMFPMATAANNQENSSPVVQEQDLFLLAEQAMQLEPMPQYRVYRMNQSRRMRSNELHYLDHPVFGMAIKVVPYELPEPKQADATP